MRLRVAEINEHAVAHVLRHEPAEALHSLGDAFLIGGNHFAQVLRVHASRECRRADQVREHHRDLAALGGVLRLRLSPGGGLRCCGGRACQLADGREHYPPMPKQDADIFEVVISQMRECRNTNPVLGKALGVLGHAELFQPVRYLLGRCRAHDDNSSSKALASLRSSVSKPSVNQP